MAKVALNKRGPYKNGYFTPINKEKYIGDVNNIIYRSSWEKRLCTWFDENKSVVFWNSESVVIPYYSPVDNKMHKYHIDFLAKMLQRDGTYKTYLIEVKPNKERFPPKNKNKKNFINEMSTYIVNQAKWAAAESFCADKGINFVIIDEFDLSIKKRA